MKLGRFRLAALPVAATLIAILVAVVVPAIAQDHQQPRYLAKKVGDDLRQIAHKALRKANRALARSNQGGGTSTPGPAGAAGPPGAPGVPGGGFGYAEVLTEESTTSSTAADLATIGPSVTVTVPANGLVSVLAQVDLKSPDGGTCFISLAEDGSNFGDLMNAFQGTTYGTYWSNTSSFGNLLRSGASLRTFPASAGAHTYKLMYRTSPTDTCDFQNRKLWVALPG